MLKRLRPADCMVIPFPGPAPANAPISLGATLTPADIRAVKRELARLPAGWFQVRAGVEEDPETSHQRSCAVLEQIWGPAIGAAFTIRRRCGLFVVTCTKEGKRCSRCDITSLTR